MKNFFNTLCRCVSTLVVVALFAAACEEVKITQPNPPTPEQELELSLSAGLVTDSSASFTVVPSLEDASYYANLFTTEEVGDDVNEFVAKLSVDSAQLYVGEKSLSFEQLTPVTDYTFIAFGYEPTKGEITTEVWSVSVVTLEASAPELGERHKISIEDVTWCDAALTITPDNLDKEFVCGIYTRAAYDEKFDTKDAIISARMAEWEAMAQQNVEYGNDDTWQYYMQLEQHVGVSSIAASELLSLGWNTEYVVYCFGIDDDGTVTSTVTIAEFKTLSAAESENRFDISVDATTEQSIIFTVTPSNDDPYFVALQPTTYTDCYGPDAEQSYEMMILDLVTAYPDDLLKEKYIFSGEQQFTSSQFLASVNHECEYKIIVCGFDNGPSTDVVLSEAIKPKAFELGLQLNSDNPSQTSASFDVYASDDYHTYHIGMYTSDEVGEDVDAFADALVEGEGFEQTLRRGSQLVTFDDLEPNEVYLVLLFTYDATIAQRGDLIVVPFSTDMDLAELSVEVAELTQTSATFNIESLTGRGTYYCGLYPDIKTSEVDVLVSDILASDDFAKNLRTGSQSVTFDNLMPGADYTFIAFAYDVAWCEMGTIHLIDITTEEPTVVEPSFELSVSGITWRDAMLSIVASDASATYVCGIISKSTYHDECSSTPRNIVDMRLAEWSARAEMSQVWSTGEEWKEYMRQELMSGSNTFEGSQLCQMRWSSDYVAYCFGMSYSGELTSEVFVEEYSTLSPMVSNNSFVVDVVATTETSVEFTVAVSNNDPYFVSVQHKSYVDCYGPTMAESYEDMIYTLTCDSSDAMLNDSIYSGTQTLRVDGLSSGDEYVVVVCGFENGPTTSVTLSGMFIAENIPVEEPVWMNCYFDDVTYKSVNFTVNISDEKHAYYCGIFANKDFTDEEALVESIVASPNFASQLKWGSATYSFDSLLANTSYTIVAFAYDIKTSAIVTDTLVFYNILTREYYIPGIGGPSYGESDVEW